MAVDDLDRAIAFYDALFGAPPALRKPGCVKWVLEDPPVNFTVSLGDNSSQQMAGEGAAATDTTPSRGKRSTA
jgi:catechol 2,3-dioxygenase-like lactoylglutathione lyase family enzyme